MRDSDPQSKPRTSSRLSRIFQWTLGNVAGAVCVWLAVIESSVVAGRILCAALWFVAAATMLVALSTTAREAAAKQGRSVPACIAGLAGWSLVLFLVYHGWWWTAVAAMLIEVAEFGIFSKKQEEEV